MGAPRPDEPGIWWSKRAWARRGRRARKASAAALGVACDRAPRWLRAGPEAAPAAASMGTGLTEIDLGAGQPSTGATRAGAAARVRAISVDHLALQKGAPLAPPPAHARLWGATRFFPLAATAAAAASRARKSNNATPKNAQWLTYSPMYMSTAPRRRALRNG